MYYLYITKKFSYYKEIQNGCNVAESNLIKRIELKKYFEPFFDSYLLKRKEKEKFL